MHLVLAQAADAAATVAAEVPTDAKSIIMYVVGTLIVMAGGWITKKVNDLAGARADKLREEAGAEGIGRVEKLRKLVEAMALDIVASLNESQLPVLAKMIRDGKLKTKAEVKAFLRSLGATAKAQLIQGMGDAGYDILDELGDTTINWIIRKTVDKASPVVGETARTMLEGGWEVVLDKGKTWLDSKETPDAVTSKPIEPADDDELDDDGLGLPPAA